MAVGHGVAHVVLGGAPVEPHPHAAPNATGLRSTSRLAGPELVAAATAHLKDALMVHEAQKKTVVHPKPAPAAESSDAGGGGRPRRPNRPKSKAEGGAAGAPPAGAQE